MYANGEGVGQDDDKAAEYYAQAAELGDEDAARMLEQLNEE